MPHLASERVVAPLAEFMATYLPLGAEVDHERLRGAISDNIKLLEARQIEQFVASVGKASGLTASNAWRRRQEDVTVDVCEALRRVVDRLMPQPRQDDGGRPPRAASRDDLSYLPQSEKDYRSSLARAYMRALVKKLREKNVYPFGNQRVVLDLDTVGALVGISVRKSNRSSVSRLLRSFAFGGRPLASVLLLSTRALLRERIEALMHSNPNASDEELRVILVDSIKENPIRKLTPPGDLVTCNLTLTRPIVHVYLRNLIRLERETKW